MATMTEVVRTGLLGLEILGGLLFLIYFGAKLGTLGVLRAMEFYKKDKRGRGE